MKIKVEGEKKTRNDKHSSYRHNIRNPNKLWNKSKGGGSEAEREINSKCPGSRTPNPSSFLFLSFDIPIKQNFDSILQCSLIKAFEREE